MGVGAALTVGDWGVEAADTVARAVVEQNGEIGVVPEPGTLTLLNSGYMGFGLAVNIVIEAKDIEEAKHKLRQEYPDCEILEGHEK
jgi:uncharacterized membrane protein YcaP (DUF421 family)